MRHQHDGRKFHFKKSILILSNTKILECIKQGLFSIDPLENFDPANDPFNTSAIDLRLGNEVLIPNDSSPIQLDLRKSGIARFLYQNSDRHTITENTPYSLKKGQFILISTFEKVKFPLNNSGICYSARVEGKSSIARCGVLIHFTAPTIHAGFEGPITLEILNLGPNDFLLTPKMYICQLIIEEVSGSPSTTDNQFSGQNSPAGVVK